MFFVKDSIGKLIRLDVLTVMFAISVPAQIMSRRKFSNMDDNSPQSFFERWVVHEARTEKAAWIILYKGKQMAVRSGKCVWVSLAAAKSALNLSLSNSPFPWKERESFYQEVKDWIYKNVEFKQVR
jgi:hypothetical protein